MGKNAKRKRKAKRAEARGERALFEIAQKLLEHDGALESMERDIIENTMDVLETEEKLATVRAIAATTKRRRRPRRRRLLEKQPLPVQQELNAYITGTGERLLNTHPREARCDEGCVIHNPTDRTGFPTHWRIDRALMERVCRHGVGHPDPDDIRYKARRFGVEYAETETTHGCDGCCAPNNPVFKEVFARERARRENIAQNSSPTGRIVKPFVPSMWPMPRPRQG